MSMFWGLVLKPNRKYSQTIGKSFHISSVAIDKGEEAKLYLTAEKQKYTVATVNKAIPQVQLDLNFSKGDQIIFQSTGDAQVSLLGYMHDDVDSEDENDDDFTIEQLANAVKGSKGADLDGDDDEEEEEEDDDDDEEDVDDSQLLAEFENGQDDDDDDEDDEEEQESDDDEEEDDSDEEEESDDEEAAAEPKAKVAKLSPTANANAKKQNGVSKNEQPKQQQQKPAKGKKEAEPSKKENTKQQASGGERTVTGGVKILDLTAGKGEEAKAGKRVAVYYNGRLQSNNKTFDSLLQGKGFKFAIGAGEVIKGWDVGVVGMKVGGKRRITCPPHMAYGGRGAPPKIPPNSTLVFDVELKSVN
ncbi:uncharacterized protein Dwil_GK11959 [Drosophila willistoni]|uniref:FK506-binding protein n=1 Tax=Drosophila willistoni TaxID=7260 RepID=B4N7Z0_DROWI|nr:39 kDa FK506-binding nuclear protein [Drosophila willistoni]EDW81241.1 uncharacterized protein Dwil_GK11959 [Drosophila willistoni]